MLGDLAFLPSEWLDNARTNTGSGAARQRIRKDRQREPIVVVQLTDPDRRGRYRIVDGSRRYRAITTVLRGSRISARIAPPAAPLVD